MVFSFGAMRFRQAESGNRRARAVLTAAVALLVGMTPAQGQNAANACAEGQFIDLSMEEPACRPLLRPDLGFDRADFEAFASQAVYVLDASDCARGPIQALLDDAEDAGGGIVDVSACDSVQVDRALRIRSGVTLQGRGMGRTVLHAPGDRIRATDDDSIGTLVDIRRSQHVVLRDLTVDGDSVTFLGVSALFSDNVLIERVELAAAINNGIDLTHTSRFTVRYSRAHGTVTFNGFSSKDCFPSFEEFSVQECIVRRTQWAGGDFGFGPMFSRDFSVYSNQAWGNRDHCLALHARHGEVAGNYCEADRTGFKFPDAQSIYVHHNRIQDARHWGIHAYAPTKGIRPDSQFVFQNLIERSGWYAIRLSGIQAFVLHNRYAGNATCIEGCPPGVPGPGVDGIRIVSSLFPDSSKAVSDVHICRDSRESLMGEEGLLPIGAVTWIDQAECLRLGAFPLALTQLAARTDSQSVELVWETAREDGTVGFEVEMSNSSATGFRALGFVDGKGTVSEPTRYAFRTQPLSNGRYWFRLRQVVLDGPPNLTPPVAVRIVPDSVLAPNEALPLPGSGARLAPAFPNPFDRSTTLTVQVDSPEVVTLDLLDALGRMVHVLYEGPLAPGSPHRYSIPAHGLAPGVYWIRLRTPGREVVRPVVRQ